MSQPAPLTYFSDFSRTAIPQYPAGAQSMSILVQHLHTRLYLGRKDAWVGLKASPRIFPNALEAISYCIEHFLRDVRLVQGAGSDKECFFYPFGQDPAIKAETKRMRRLLAEHRRLEQEARTRAARIDMLMAQAKERKKQRPFQRKNVASPEYLQRSLFS